MYICVTNKKGNIMVDTKQIIASVPLAYNVTSVWLTSKYDIRTKEHDYILNVFHDPIDGDDNFTVRSMQWKREELALDVQRHLIFKLENMLG